MHSQTYRKHIFRFALCPAGSWDSSSGTPMTQEMTVRWQSSPGGYSELLPPICLILFERCKQQRKQGANDSTSSPRRSRILPLLPWVWCTLGLKTQTTSTLVCCSWHSSGTYALLGCSYWFQFLKGRDRYKYSSLQAAGEWVRSLSSVGSHSMTSQKWMPLLLRETEAPNFSSPYEAHQVTCFNFSIQSTDNAIA